MCWLISVSPEVGSRLTWTTEYDYGSKTNKQTNTREGEEKEEQEERREREKERKENPIHHLYQFRIISLILGQGEPTKEMEGNRIWTCSHDGRNIPTGESNT